ncbi:MAG: PadR family transcriptional regulator [Candidatus Latescibacteria bacterium]|nr:PadR family transcriptional regulator [Candidatus Latescibacterota bacterium]
MTLNEALILSYVKRGIGYGYNILTHVKNSGSDEWVVFSRAGLYKTLDKLEKSECIVKQFEQNGNRPPKKVYSMTTKGEKELEEFLETGFNFDFQTKNDLDAYLVTAVAASPEPEKLAQTIVKRKEAVRKHLAILKNDWPEDKNKYPFIVYVLYRRRMDSLEAEYAWLDWLEAVLKNVSGDVMHITWGESGK